jgi:hypothetical protein
MQRALLQEILQLYQLENESKLPVIARSRKHASSARQQASQTEVIAHVTLTGKPDIDNDKDQGICMHGTSEEKVLEQSSAIRYSEEIREHLQVMACSLDELNILYKRQRKERTRMMSMITEIAKRI